MHKICYFQGGKDPEKYTPEDRLVEQVRFVEPFFNNYDLYDIDGKTGPGTGFYSHMHDFDSVRDFLKKRKMNKKKSNDLWVSPSGKIKSKKADRRLALLKVSFDFPADSQVDPIVGDGDPYSSFGLLGGFGDHALTQDFEDKNPSDLDVGRPENPNADWVEDIESTEFLGLISSLLNGTDAVAGLTGGLDPDAVDADATISENYNGMVSDNNDGTKVVF